MKWEILKSIENQICLSSINIHRFYLCILIISVSLLGVSVNVDRIDEKHLNKMCAMLDLHRWMKWPPPTKWIRTVAMWWMLVQRTHPVQVKSVNCQIKICPDPHHANQMIRQYRNFINHYSNHRTKMTWTVSVQREFMPNMDGGKINSLNLFYFCHL